MTDIDVLLTTDAAPGDGREVSADGWRFVVRLAIAEGGTWGALAWGTSTWGSTWHWEDLSDRLRGCSWERGGDVLEGRPPTGSGAFSLSSDDGFLSPWDTASAFPADRRAHLSAGTIIQCGWLDPSDVWTPAFTGTLERLEEQAAGLDGDVWVIITAAETTEELAVIDHPAGAASGTEGFAARVARLLDDALWLYGTNLGAVPLAHDVLQSTTLADNRLSEVYLAGDSSGMAVFSDRDGRLRAAAQGTFTDLELIPGDVLTFGERATSTTWTGLDLDVVPWSEAPVFAEDEAQIRNVWRLARTGGTEQLAEDPVSVAWHGRRAVTRTDLIATTDAQVLELAEYLADVVESESRPNEVSALKVDAYLTGLDLVAALDLYLAVYVLRSWIRWPDRAPFLWRCAVSRYTVNVVALGPDRAQVSAELDVSALENIPADVGIS